MDNINSKNIVVLYHGDCPDGFCSAWSAWKRFKDSACYSGVKLGFSPPENLIGKEIYTLDFSYSVEFMQQLLKNNKKLVAIDHHISNQDSIKTASDYRFDMNHSGAVLSWNYFHPNKKIPRILNHVEDMDLYRFKLPNTKAITTYLVMFKFDFKIWDKIISDMEDDDKFKAVIPQGELLLKYEEALVNMIIERRAELVNFEGYKVYAVNSSIFDSQIGSKLYEKKPPLGIVWFRDNIRLKFSLRSDETVDVSKIAQKFAGGGGHKRSAGFSLPIDSKLPWKKI